MNLTFRTKGLPKGLIRRVLLLVGLFLGCLILFFFILNYQHKDTTSEMSAPTLPTVSLTAGGREISALRAYTAEMDACYMRDAVAPLDETRILPINIKTYGNKISDISYQIRSLDTARKIAETKITDIPAAENGVITVSPELENLIEDGDEYLFVLNMKADGRELNFYTRIIMPKNAHQDEIASFAEDFSQKARDGNSTALATYIEPAEDAANTDTTGLAEVTIKSTAADVCWVGFSGDKTGDTIFEWNDISDNYSALTMYYTMRDETGDIYDVTEYFKVRYGTERMFLLDYDRRMMERFTPRASRVSGNNLSLGVIPSDYQMRSNENGLIVAFVQGGELYEYVESKGEFITLFSFNEYSGAGREADERALWNEHAIKILSIDETGTVDFVVYGYMNAGRHEGLCGIDVMRFDATTGHTTEQTFIRSKKSFQILNANFSELIYKSSTDDFYIMEEGSLVHVNLSSMAINTIAYGLAESEYAVSDTRRYVALDGGAIGSTDGTIVIKDLEAGTDRTIRPESGEQLRVLAFMDDDLVYGRVREGDIREAASGLMVYPMYELDIISASSSSDEVLMTYAKPGLYVTDSKKEDAALNLTRVTKAEDGSLAAAPGDTIRNAEGEVNRAVSLERSPVEGKGIAATLVMAKFGSSENTASGVSAYTAPLVLMAKGHDIDIQVSDVEEQYFVYVGSRVVAATYDVTEAVSIADVQMGIVIDNSQNYIWKRGLPVTGKSGGKLSASNAGTSRGQALAAMLSAFGENVDVDTLLEQGQSVAAIMAATLPDRKVLNLTGATLQEVLYYVSRGEPVYGELSDDTATIISAYDAANVTLFNPATGKTEKMGRNDAAAAFAAAGNTFVTVLDQAK
ncbi:MAG: hypothetical protein VZQ80_08045 [Lachnospiraceae bacterium]|nr:hypothetical protein [Lachnospiraceae bacterium]